MEQGVFGVLSVLLLMFWEVSLSIGLAGLGLYYLSRKLKRLEVKNVKKCEQEFCACRINRKNSVNPPPMAEAIRAAWKATRWSRRGDPDTLAARLRLGVMLSDLEPVVDQSYIRDADGTIVGRKPGLRGWINLHCPELAPHYKSLMAYKALADKLRVALCIREPDTLDGVLDLEPMQSKNSVETAKGTSAQQEARRENERKNGGTEIPKSRLVKKDFTVKYSNVEEIQQSILTLFPFGMPCTMVGLETVVRERLGQAWMRRGRKKPLVA